MSTNIPSPLSANYKLAIIGGGVSGLAAAWHACQTHPQASITLFEAGTRLGGHANTVDITLGGKTFGVDTGFLVYNEATYPNFIKMLVQLGVHSSPSDMGFSVQVPKDAQGTPGLEWAGNSLSAVFAQRKNLLSPTFWAMLKDMLRFNKLCTTLAKKGQDDALQESVGEFLAKHQFGKPFIDNYFLPMIACIWSCPAEQMMAFPMATMVRFCHNHGLLQLIGRPQWFTITGGSRHYVKAIEKSLLESKRCELHVNASVNAVQRSADCVSIISAAGTETFDGVLFAGHSDQALAVLEQGTGATEQERQILGAIRYQNNRAVLHTDTTLMPKNKIAWAAWNYEKSPPNDAQQTVCLHYWLNKLQPLPTQVPVMVTLNPIREPAASTVIQSYDYAHPVFDAPAIAAQAQVASIQGERTWFAGAWCKFGFHEDGFTSGTQAAALACASLAQLNKNE